MYGLRELLSSVWTNKVALCELFLPQNVLLIKMVWIVKFTSCFNVHRSGYLRCRIIILCIQIITLYIQFWFLLSFSFYLSKSKIFQKLTKIFTSHCKNVIKMKKTEKRRTRGSVNTVDYNAKKRSSLALTL